MSLRKRARHILDVIDLENGAADLYACVALLVKIRSGILFSSRVVVDRHLDDVFSIALNGQQLGGVRAKRLCRMKTGKAASSQFWACVSCVDGAGQQVA